MRWHFGILLTIAVLVSLVLGTEGFYAIDRESGWPTAFYRAAQLFYWNASFGADVPWTLEVARWLAPLTTLGALLRVGLTVFRERWHGFRARRLRGHAVVCGAGEKGSSLARELCRAGVPVVVIDPDASRLEGLAAAGAYLIPGDATKPQVLRQCGVTQAARILIATGDDHRNLAVALAAAQLGKGSIHAHSGDAPLCDLYQRHCAQADLAAVRVFSHHRNMARCTLRDFPPDFAGGEVHVVLPDLSPSGVALAVEYALMGHWPDGRKIHLHIVHPQAQGQLAIFLARCPGIGECLVVDAVELPSAEMFSSRVVALAARSPGPFTVFPGFTEDGQAFSRALELLELWDDEQPFLVLLPGSESSPLRSLVDRKPALARHLNFLPSAERTYSREVVIGESLDRIAREIHENWLKETQRQMDQARSAGDEASVRRHQAKATFRPWENLTEEQKGANRSQADHMPFKIRAAGFDPETVTAVEWSGLSATQVERLASMEHDRWAAYYRMTGWTFAPERNDMRKQHPNLVAYDDLDEPAKEYDREAVRNLGGYLRRVAAD